MIVVVVVVALMDVLFQMMEDPFLYSVKLILGERYTDNMHSIYKTVIAIILSELEKGCINELGNIKKMNK